ncbi:MAG: NADH-quinone oxidoreductase subunit N [Planctomycetota bacterium]
MDISPLAGLQLSLKYYLPYLIPAGFSLLLLLFEIILTDETIKKVSLIYLAVAGLILTGVSALLYYGSIKKTTLFSNLIVVDNLSLFFQVVFVITGVLCYIISLVEKEMEKYNIGEFFFLLVSTIFGLSLMITSNNLLMLLVSIELVSLCSYALSGYFYNNKRSSESALKYSLFGASTSGIAIFGLSLIAVSCGSIYFSDIAGIKDLSLGIVGWILFLGILFYKISAVPFHMWTPDIYEGAPLAISAFLSTAPKAAGFVALIRILESASSSNQLLIVLFSIISLISAISMTFGNLSALHQTNYKRLLAYSTIAHSGYILVGLSALALSLLKNEGVMFSLNSIVFYILIYIAMNLGAFLYLGYFANFTGESINNLSGIAKFFTLEGVLLTIMLLSLTGLPPTGGFIAKLNVFASAIQLKGLLWLVIIALLNTVISVAYYFKIFKNIFFPPEKIVEISFTPQKKLSSTVNFIGFILVAIIILSCIYPQIFYNLTFLTS